METTLSHKTRLAIHYKGSKGRKVAWIEDWNHEEVFIPKYREPEIKPQTPRKSKYRDMLLDLRKKLETTSFVELQSEKPAELRRALCRAADMFAPELRFITHTKQGTITVVKRKE